MHGGEMPETQGTYGLFISEGSHLVDFGSPPILLAFPLTRLGIW
jgi:hypothetical protein